LVQSNEVRFYGEKTAVHLDGAPFFHEGMRRSGTQSRSTAWGIERANNLFFLVQQSRQGALEGIQNAWRA
jgi:hypothetical protein